MNYELRLRGFLEGMRLSGADFVKHKDGFAYFDLRPDSIFLDPKEGEDRLRILAELVDSQFMGTFKVKIKRPAAAQVRGPQK